MARKLIIVSGPTAVGKTEWCIDLALRHSSPVISCDSRQIYREMTIGTAIPDASQLAAVKHYFIQTGSVFDPYTAGRYEQEAIGLMDRLFDKGHETLVMAGGSGFYAEAVCRGLDDLPPEDAELRKLLQERLAREGVESLRMDLKKMDPLAYGTMDVANPRRVLRAVEVCLLSGRPFSSFRLDKARERDFEIEKICLIRPRNVLYDRIDRRVEKMVEAGLVDEARSLFPMRDLPALQTVGYRELFGLFAREAGVPAAADGKETPPRSLDEAVERIQRNTRHYAKKQITWWKRDPSVRWVEL